MNTLAYDALPSDTRLQIERDGRSMRITQPPLGWRYARRVTFWALLGVGSCAAAVTYSVWRMNVPISEPSVIQGISAAALFGVGAALMYVIPGLRAFVVLTVEGGRITLCHRFILWTRRIQWMASEVLEIGPRRPLYGDKSFRLVLVPKEGLSVWLLSAREAEVVWAADVLRAALGLTGGGDAG